MRKSIWGVDEQDEWKAYCRRIYREEHGIDRPMRCKHLIIVPHHMLIEHLAPDGKRLFKPLEKGEMVCATPLGERCGIKNDLRLNSDGTISGYCQRKHTPIKFKITSFDRP